MLVPKGARRLDGLDAMIVSLYAGGMTVRDIGRHLEATIGTDLSLETISNVVDAVADQVLAWPTFSAHLPECRVNCAGDPATDHLAPAGRAPRRTRAITA